MVHPDSVEVTETTSVNPGAGETEEQQEAVSETIADQDLLNEELHPVFDKEARAKHVLDLLPKGNIGHGQWR